jgi:hypothetical protein
VPVDQQVWALVNQPALNFSSQPRSLGYWLGSIALPLFVSLTAVRLWPKSRTLGCQLWTVHLAWANATVALAWLPLLDRADGHVARWLALHQLPSVLLWLAPILSAVAAFPATLRLLALTRVARPHTGRWLRLAMVALHLGVPCSIWAGLAWAVSGRPPIVPAVAMMAPLAIAASVAWFGYPTPFPHRLDPLSRTSWLRVAACAVIILGLLLAAGRPLAGDLRAGLLWGEPRAYNNIRPWIARTSVWSPLTILKPEAVRQPVAGDHPGRQPGSV